jgi:hypothetical protein
MYFDDRLLGQYNLTNLIGQDMQHVSAVLSLLLETKHGVAFLNRLAKPVYDTLKMQSCFRIGTLYRVRPALWMQSIDKSSTWERIFRLSFCSMFCAQQQR